MKKIFKNLFTKRNEAWDGATVDLGIEPRFVDSSDMQIYSMREIANTYCERGLQCMSVWEEWNMRCTKEYLQLWLINFDKAVDNGQAVKLTEIINLRNDIKQRIEFIVPTSDIIWRLASYMFFDKTENPYVCDEAYSKEKIKRWRGDGKADAFFFNQLKNWMPLPDISTEDLASCLAVVNMIGREKLTEMLSGVSSEELSKGLLQELEYQNSLMSELKS